jgi:hypothetical protein
MPPWGFLASRASSETLALAVSESFFPQKPLALGKRPDIIAIERLFESKYCDLDTATSIRHYI